MRCALMTRTYSVDSPLTLVRVTSRTRLYYLGDSRWVPTRSLTAPLLTYSTCGFAKEMGEAGRDHLMALLYSKCSRKRWSTTFWGVQLGVFGGDVWSGTSAGPQICPRQAFRPRSSAPISPPSGVRSLPGQKLPVSTRSRAILANVALRRLGKYEKKNRKQQNYGQLRGIVDSL